LTKIFVAGATGYIGTNVVKSALEKNFDVVAAKREESADFGLKHQKLTIIKISENDNSWVDKLKDIDDDIRNFLRRNMYDHKDVQKRNNEGKKIVNFLFKMLYSNTKNNFSIQNFDKNKARSVADFISGMTDRYAINLYEELK